MAERKLPTQYVINEWANILVKAGYTGKTPIDTLFAHIDLLIRQDGFDPYEKISDESGEIWISVYVEYQYKTGRYTRPQ